MGPYLSVQNLSVLKGHNSQKRFLIPMRASFSRSMHRKTSTYFSPLFDEMEEVSPEASHRSRAHAAPREREAYGHNHRPAVAPSHSPMPIHSDTLSLHNIF